MHDAPLRQPLAPLPRLASQRWQKAVAEGASAALLVRNKSYDYLRPLGYQIEAAIRAMYAPIEPLFERCSRDRLSRSEAAKLGVQWGRASVELMGTIEAVRKVHMACMRGEPQQLDCYKPDDQVVADPRSLVVCFPDPIDCPSLSSTGPDGVRKVSAWSFPAVDAVLYLIEEGVYPNHFAELVYDGEGARLLQSRLERAHVGSSTNNQSRLQSRQSRLETYNCLLQQISLASQSACDAAALALVAARDRLATATARQLQLDAAAPDDVAPLQRCNARVNKCDAESAVRRASFQATWVLQRECAPATAARLVVHGEPCPLPLLRLEEDKSGNDDLPDDPLVQPEDEPELSLVPANDGPTQPTTVALHQVKTEMLVKCASGSAAREFVRPIDAVLAMTLYARQKLGGDDGYRFLEVFLPYLQTRRSPPEQWVTRFQHTPDVPRFVVGRWYASATNKARTAFVFAQVVGIGNGKVEIRHVVNVLIGKDKSVTPWQDKSVQRVTRLHSVPLIGCNCDHLGPTGDSNLHESFTAGGTRLCAHRSASRGHRWLV